MSMRGLSNFEKTLAKIIRENEAAEAKGKVIRIKKEVWYEK